jgi:hypothetical protein
MYRLNQIEFAILCYFVVINASEGSLCFQIFFELQLPSKERHTQTEPATFSIFVLFSLFYWTMLHAKYLSSSQMTTLTPPFLVDLVYHILTVFST